MTKTVPIQYSRCMTIYKRRGLYWSKIMRNGELHRRSLGVTRLADARRLETTLKTKVAEGKMGLAAPPTFEEFCPEFLNYSCHRVASTTFTAYTYAIMSLKSLPELAACPLDRVGMALVDKYVAKCMTEGSAVATINLRLRCLRRILHIAHDRELITKVPRIHGIKGENRRDYVISETDEARLIDAFESRTMRLLLPFLIETGLRISEAVALTWDDVTETTVSVKKGKTKLARRTIPLTKKAVEILRGLRSRAGFESTDMPTMPDARKLAEVSKTHGASASQTTPIFDISDTSATMQFMMARRKVGLPDGCVLHSTRHTFCTRLAKSGATPFELQGLAGHSNIQMSARYTHVDQEQLAGAIDRLNK